MDHYKILGLQRNATKDEIKAAFKKLAFQFHPDKHSQSSKPVRDNATIKFKQVSEAYEVLMDDRKRADYNIRSRSGTSSSRNGFSAAGSSSGYNYYYHYSYKYNYGGNGSTYKHKGRFDKYGSGFAYYKYGSGVASKFDPALRFIILRAFVLSFVFGGALLGGIFFINRSSEALWKRQNPGKSFEEAMEAIEKSKAERRRDDKESY